jgi:hypothetical protein
MSTTYPLEIWTINSYLQTGYTAEAWCHDGCGWIGQPDLAALAAQGYGEKPLRDLGLACPVHSRPVGLTIHPSPGFGNR